jgi:hypothetical protein
MESVYRYLKYNIAGKPANRNSIAKGIWTKRFLKIGVAVVLLAGVVSLSYNILFSLGFKWDFWRGF